jgi:hypothetical protein
MTVSTVIARSRLLVCAVMWRFLRSARFIFYLSMSLPTGETLSEGIGRQPHCVRGGVPVPCDFCRPEPTPRFGRHCRVAHHGFRNDVDRYYQDREAPDLRPLRVNSRPASVFRTTVAPLVSP